MAKHTSDGGLRDLARAGATARLEAIGRETENLLRMFPDLARSASAVRAVAAPEAARPRRRRRSAAERRAVNERMKKHQAARRRQKR